MKNLLWISLLLSISYPVPARQDAPPQPADHLTTSTVIDAWITNTETHLLGVADAMPEQKYAFAPTIGQFAGVSTFAQQLKHVAANNYRMAHTILGEKPTPDQLSEKGPDAITTKPEVLAYLKGSFAALHKAVATINDKNLVHPIPGTSGTWQRARLGLAIDAVAHSFDHYGQLVEYLRMNNIVPPDSR